MLTHQLTEVKTYWDPNAPTQTRGHKTAQVQERPNKQGPVGTQPGRYTDFDMQAHRGIQTLTN